MGKLEVKGERLQVKERTKYKKKTQESEGGIAIEYALVYRLEVKRLIMIR
jgi:hypothetical protein